MKFKKLTFLVLASMAMGALAGCGNKKEEPKPDPTPTPTPQPETMPEEYDLLKYWAGNEAENFYTVEEKADSTVITYEDVTGEDAGGWAYVARSFSYDSAKVAKFSEYKKVIFEGKLEKRTGSNIVMVKVEGTDGNQWEKRFTFASEVKTYEFGLNFITDWTKVGQILFFVNRSTNESGSGVITLNKMALSKADVVAANDIAPGMPTVPQGFAYYDEVDAKAEAKFDVMYHWGYSNDGHIATAEEGGAYTFTWGNDVGWDYVTSKVQNRGAKLQASGFKRIVFEVKGTADQPVILKFQTLDNSINKETKVKLTGEKQLVEVDVSAILAAPDTVTTFMAVIFPTAGFTGELFAGELVLSKCYLDKTEVVAPVVLDNKVEYHGAFLDNPSEADLAYKVTPNTTTHVTTIDYKLSSAPDYRSVQYKLKPLGDDEWFGAANYRRFAGKISANVNVGVILKAYDVEIKLDLVANEPQYVDKMFTEAQVDFSKPILIMIGTTSGSALAGKITVEGLQMARFNANVGGEGDTVKIDVVHDQHAFKTCINDDGDLQVIFAKAAVDYDSLDIRMNAANLSSLNTIKGTVTSAVTTHVMFKVGTEEKAVALTAGVPQELNIAFTTVLQNGWDAKLIVFVSYADGDALVGGVVFRDLRLTDGTHDITPAQKNKAPVGNYSGYATAGEGQVWFNIAVGGASGLIYVEIYDTAQHIVPTNGYEYNPVTKKLLIKLVEETVTYGNIEAEYDATNDKLIKMTLLGPAKDAISNNGEFELAQAGHFWSCNNPFELNSVFGRRTRTKSPDAWSAELGEIKPDYDHSVSGGVGLLRTGGDKSTEKANGVVMRSDFNEAVTIKNIGFWVYNHGEADVKVRCWIFRAKNFQSWQNYTDQVAKAGQWTYIRVGGNYNIYNFNLSVFNDTADVSIPLTFDNIALF